jgi:hypothetical protein
MQRKDWYFVQYNSDYNWRERRKLSYLFKQFDDINLPRVYIDKQGDELAHQIIEFFVSGSQLIYPAKSYFVAIVYAKCLEHYFNVPFYEALDTPDLLIDDEYFVPYSKNKHVYDLVVDKLDNLWYYQSINKTVNYFKEEFLIESN